MKHFASLTGACLSIALLAACSSTSVPSLSAPMPLSFGRTSAKQTTRSLPAADGPNLYVASFSGNVTVYGSGRKTVLRTIARGVNQPYSLAFDNSGNLCVANLAHSGQVYAPGR